MVRQRWLPNGNAKRCSISCTALWVDQCGCEPREGASLCAAVAFRARPFPGASMSQESTELSVALLLTRFFFFNLDTP